MNVVIFMVAGNYMSTEEWLQKVCKIIMESDSDEKTELMLKFARIAADLGYQFCFDDEE